MGLRVVFRVRHLFWLFLGCSLALTGGCYVQRKSVDPEEKPPPPQIRKVVVYGFKSALSEGQDPDVVRDPLSGAIFRAEPVPDEISEQMTEILFERLIEQERGYDLISPGQALGSFSSIVTSNKTVGMRPVAVLQEVGNTFKADAVLAGYIYRWREREGSDFAVNRPASVAFDLHMVRPRDGAIIWRSKFDKTQQSLLENILEASTFFQHGGRWLTAERLAMIGLDKVLQEMPGPVGEKEPEIDRHSSH